MEANLISAISDTVTTTGSAFTAGCVIVALVIMAFVAISELLD